MGKKNEKIDKNISAENPEEAPVEKTKRSFKNRIGRSLMATEFRNKDKEFVSKVNKIKDEMYDALATTGFFDSKYVNSLFRLYANNDKDIKIYKPQLKLPKYSISIPDVPKENMIKMTQYIKMLRFIRNGLHPLTEEIRALVNEARTYATNETKKENEQDKTVVYDAFTVDTEKETERNVAKKHLKELIEKKGYDWNRFSGESAIMSDYFSRNNHQDLMVFAVFGFHYFEKKHEVYDAFTDKQMEESTIFIDLPGLRTTTVSLGIFLKTIEHLDFKKHLFSV